ncbi:MAG: hypothetical protein H7301_11150 [Cryobacterium sp.]|nr:hypothetical protein [Oligoflexia bacterium]
MRPLYSFLAILLLPALAIASSFFDRPFFETVRETPVIIRGKVGKSEVREVTGSDGSRRLFTMYDVKVSEGLKGEPRAGSTVQIRELGGEKNGVTLSVSGTAQFSAGDDVVVMLGSSGSEETSYPVQGMMMGRYSVEKGKDGIEILEGPGLGLSTPPGMRRENSADGKSTVVSLDQLREIIRAQATEPSPVAPDPAETQAMASLKILPTATPPENRTGSASPELKSNQEFPARAPLSSPSSRMILGLGILIGSIWFLINRKKKR